MYVSTASCSSCVLCPFRTRRTYSFLMPWETCLPPHSLENSNTQQATRQSMVRQKELGQLPMGDFPAFLGPQFCPVPYPATPQALWRPLTDHVAWGRTHCFSHCPRGGSLCLRALWTVRSAHPPVHIAHGDALTPMTLQRCVLLPVCVHLCVIVCCHVVCFLNVVLWVFCDSKDSCRYSIKRMKDFKKQNYLKRYPCA